MLNIIYCCDFFNKKSVDMDYLREYEIAKKLGFNIILIDIDDLSYGKLTITKKEINTLTEKSIYRGWMLSPQQYETLYKKLLEENYYLINNPQEYKHCHYFIENYNKIENTTPHSEWLRQEDLTPENIINILGKFGEKPIIIKDYVKSRKHEWNEAFFIPNAQDTESALKVINTFIERQGEGLSGGIVLRKFEKLKFLTNHSKSNMPLDIEFRIFFFEGKPLQIQYYWDERATESSLFINEGYYNMPLPNIDKFINIAKTIQSNFFTMDIAQKENGEWIIIELGDGQVSGLSDKVNILEFYNGLMK